MNLIDALYHEDNAFQDGNAAENKEATFVNAKWLNCIQNELKNIVLAAGLELAQDVVDHTQVKQAMDILLSRGGSASKKTDVANNVTNQDVVGLIDIPSETYQAILFDFDIYRKTDTDGEFRELGDCVLIWDFAASEWKLEQVNYKLGDGSSGVEFDISEYDVGADSFLKLLHSSSNLLGANHVSRLYVTNIKYIKRED